MNLLQCMNWPQSAAIFFCFGVACFALAAFGVTEKAPRWLFAISPGLAQGGANCLFFGCICLLLCYL